MPEFITENMLRLWNWEKIVLTLMSVSIVTD